MKNENNTNINELIHKLFHGTESEKIHSIHSLGEIKTIPAYLLLLQSLKNEKIFFIKEYLVNYLKKFIYRDIYKNVFYLFFEDDAYLRTAAIQIFSSGGKEIVSFLRASFNTSNDDVKKLILDTLFEISSIDAIKGIREGMHASNINIRMTTVEYLARLEDFECLPEIIQLLRIEKEPMMIMVLLESVLILGKEESMNEAIEIILPGRKIDKICTLNSIFLSQLLKLLARTSSKSEFLSILEIIPEKINFYHDIIVFIQFGIKNYIEIFDEIIIRKKIINILLFDDYDNKITFDLLQLLSNANIPEISAILDEFIDKDLDNAIIYKHQIAELLQESN
jgi:hypothetical protein